MPYIQEMHSMAGVNMDDEGERRIPAIVLVGVGGGGSRITSEGLEKINKLKDIDRYACIARAIAADSDEPHVYIVDTSADPTTKGFYTNIPVEHKISLSGSIRGMSRGAGGKPGRAAKAVLNTDVSRTLAEKLYKPIKDLGPAIVVFMHTADGGTGGGLTPEVLLQLAYCLPMSTVFWVFSVMPTQSDLSLNGPRTVAPNIGKMLKMIRYISSEDYSHIPFDCREAIRSVAPMRRTDKSYEFKHSRIAIFPMSNEHFAQCHTGHSRKEIREEVLNPFPIEVLSQALYPFLKYVVCNQEEQEWMQEHWPMGPIDLPDIMAGVSPARPLVLPHLWVDPEGWEDERLDNVIEDLKEGRIKLEKTEGNVEEGIPDVFTFTGAPTSLFEFRANSLYCIPISPQGSPYFDEFGDLVSDHWFPKLSHRLNFVGGADGRRVGVISHSANLKPQPVPTPTEGRFGFESGLLVTLIFGGIPGDFIVWLRSTRNILKEHKTDKMWELSYYDANDYLKEVALYIGWKDWEIKELDGTDVE
jgi:hypothetical protein